ncbi:MAG: polysaccharide deacetylase family protein [Acidobacteriaceae bacterium]
MKWTIVIPTWRRAKVLAALLERLGTQTCRDFEVVVVCDGEDLETREVSESPAYDFPLRWIFHPQNLGLAAARDTGAQAARGEFLLFLDDDVAPDPHLLEVDLKAHAEAQEWPSSAICGRIIEERQTAFVSKTDEFLQRSWEEFLAQALPPERTPNTASIGSKAELSAWFGLNCSIRRELFEILGGFDGRLRSDEEMEFGLRLYRAGMATRYVPGAVVRHHGSGDQSKYYPRCWRLSGELDVYRAREKKERSAQIRQLADITEASATQRLLARAAWENPDAVLALASVFERVTDATGSRSSFAVWTRLRHAGEYWKAARATGILKDELLQLLGSGNRILLFHSLSRPVNAREREYYISPERFQRCLSWLEMMQYRHAHAKEWIEERVPKQSVLLTFDDAYDDLYTELLPQVSRFRLRPLVFVVVDRIGGTNVWDEGQGLRKRSLLTLERMREMQRHGVTFASHSLTHPNLSSLPNSELHREVRDSKAKLEDLLGVSVEWFAYPFGVADRRVRAAVAEAGYKAAVTTNAGFNSWQDPLALNRLEVDERDWLIDFALKVATGRSYRRGLLNRLFRASAGEPTPDRAQSRAQSA